VEEKLESMEKADQTRAGRREAIKWMKPLSISPAMEPILVTAVQSPGCRSKQLRISRDPQLVSGCFCDWAFFFNYFFFFMF
jgi:hypothetical protein